MLTYARGNVPWPWDTAWDQRAKMIGAIDAGGGGGGGSTDYMLTGAVDPSATPADAAKVWRYTNMSTGTEWVWASTSPWVQVV